VARNLAWGITGATSNPVISAALIESCECDEHIARFLSEGLTDDEIAWRPMVGTA
jgi:hypothetical protein